MKDWQRECSMLLEENARLLQEIRHLRCVMVEAACSVDPSGEPVLFKHLTGDHDHFVDHHHNPYPDHDDHVSDQYMRALTAVTEDVGGYDREDDLGELFRLIRER